MQNKVSNYGDVTELGRRRCKKQMADFILEPVAKKAKEENTTFDKCIICLTKKKGDWIQCDKCVKWFHQECVPNCMKRKMKKCISNVDVEFICHLCSC